MQLKFNRQKSIGQSIGIKAIKLLIFLIAILLLVFVIEKVKFPSPNKSIKKDITNEVIKLK